MEEKTEDKSGFILTRWMRGLYQWVMGWADRPNAEKMLGALSFAESSFFPIPPDVLLIPMAISRQDKAIRFAAVTSVTSVLGGMVGYLIGWAFFDTVGIKIIEFYGVLDKYYLFREWFEEYNFAIIMVAGLTPLPYKVFTITAGVAGVNFPIFVLGSVVSRSTRFMSEGVVCYHGDFFSEKIFKMPIKEALDKYINLFAVGMAALGVAGFLVVNMVLPGSEVDIEKRFELSRGTVEVTAHFYSAESEEDKHLFNYRLTVARDGSTVGAEVPFGPYPEPTKGKADVRLIEFDSGRAIVAAVFYYDRELSDDDLDASAIKATDGQAALFLLYQGKLTYLNRITFPRYVLGGGGDYTEAKLAGFEVVKDGGGDGSFFAEIVSRRHTSGGEDDGSEEKKTLHYKLEKGALLQMKP